MDKSFVSTDSAGNITISLGRKYTEYGETEEPWRSNKDLPYISGYMEDNIFRVLYIYVPESRRREGIGRVLLKKAYEYTGATKVLPDLDVTPSGIEFMRGLKRF